MYGAAGNLESTEVAEETEDEEAANDGDEAEWAPLLEGGGFDLVRPPAGKGSVGCHLRQSLFLVH